MSRIPHKQLSEQAFGVMSSLYPGLLAAILEDEMVTPDEEDRLRAFRAKHRISAEQHKLALEGLGYSVEVYEKRVAQGEEIDAYMHVVSATLEECESQPEEAGLRLAAYRETHSVDSSMAAKALGLLGMSPAQFEVRCSKPSDGAIATYAAMLHTALLKDSFSESEELRREDYRKAHGISDAAHVQALQSLSISEEEYNARRRKLVASALADVQADGWERQFAPMYWPATLDPDRFRPPWLTTTDLV